MLLLFLLARPLHWLLGGAFILGMACIGMLAIIHPARVNAHHVAAAISQQKYSALSDE